MTSPLTESPIRQHEAMLELGGWIFHPGASDPDPMRAEHGTFWENPKTGVRSRFPALDFHEVRCLALTTQQLKVQYLTHLRSILEKGSPKNAAGAPIVSDYDMITATHCQHVEALLRACGKWAD